MSDEDFTESFEPASYQARRVFVLGQPEPDTEALERNAVDAAAGARRIGMQGRPVATLGIEWTVLGPTRQMTNLHGRRSLSVPLAGSRPRCERRRSGRPYERQPQLGGRRRLVPDRICNEVARSNTPLVRGLAGRQRAVLTEECGLTRGEARCTSSCCA